MYRKETRTCFVSKSADDDKGGSVGAKSRFRGSMKARPPDLPGSLGGFRSVLIAAALAALVVAWAATNLLSGGEGFAMLVSDNVVEGEEAASALARLFAALVLGLFLADAVGWRARWVAGVVAQAQDHLIFGYLEGANTEAGRGGKSSWGRLVAQGPAVVTLMCVQADLSRCSMCKVQRAVESPLRGYNDLQGGFEEL
jgi:hypothetical protein